MERLLEYQRPKTMSYGNEKEKRPVLVGIQKRWDEKEGRQNGAKLREVVLEEGLGIHLDNCGAVITPPAG